MQHYENIRTHASDRPSKSQIQRWQTQERKVFEAFFQEPMTMLMCEQRTGVMRPSICRFVASLKRENKIRVVRVDTDPLTKCKAQFLSTNPKHWPQPALPPGTQTNLFQ